jgi:nucleotide-binding universal stress UspA family protein
MSPTPGCTELLQRIEQTQGARNQTESDATKEVIMFKRILVPIDGSKRAEHAALAAVDFARDLNASIMLFHAYPTFQIIVAEPVFLPPDLLSEEAYAKSQRGIAHKYFEPVIRYAGEAGVHVEESLVANDATARAIVDAAEDPSHPCDAIFMAAHGRGELMQALLGSVTTRVLSLCSTPVMVYRDPKAKKAKEGKVREAQEGHSVGKPH